jgi:4-amino-4-deoxy-L-arabinose transferase-like glycosyltransferase
MIIPFLLATWLGGKLFGRMNSSSVRAVALGLMLFVGAVGLLV